MRFCSRLPHRSSNQAVRRQRAAAPRRRPRLEGLEDRTVPTGPTLSIPLNLAAFQGGIVAVPVNIDKLTDGAGNNGLSRADFAIDYDPTVFSVSSADVFLGTVPAAGLNWQVTATNFAAGQLGITISTTTPTPLNLSIPVGSVDSLIAVDFHVLPGAAVSTTSINLAASNAAGPTTTDLFDAGGTQYAFGTAPTNSASDAGVDGSVNVLPASAAPPEGSWSGDPGSGSNVSPLTLTPTVAGNNPGGIGTMLLLNDGSVMANGGLDGNSQDWFRLSPTANGDYSQGTWTRLAPMNTQRLFFGSAVLKDGRVLVYGGEYSGPNPAPAATEINSGELFTPPTTPTGTGSWKQITPIPATLDPANQFGDGQLELMNDGTVLAGDLNTGATYRYNPNNDPLLNPSLPAGTQPWSADKAQANGDRSSEESWVKLGDGSILTYENFGTAPQTGQRFVPGTTQAADEWKLAGSVPVTLSTAGVGATDTIAAAVGPGGSAPIQITSTNPLPVGFGTNSQVTISGVAGFAAVNSSFNVTVTGTNTFTLNGTAGTVGTATANTGGWSKNLVPGAELGPAFLLPDGRVFYTGATNSTALYTPPEAAGNATGTWVAGPTIPLGLGANDSSGAVLPNGRVLFAAGATPFFGPGINTINPVPTGTSLFEYDPATNTINQVTDLPPNFSASLAGRSCFVTRMLVLPSGQVLITDSSGQPYLYTPTGGPDPSWRPTITGLSKNADGSLTLAGAQLNGLSEGAGYGDDAQMATNYPIVELRDQAGNVSYAPTTQWTSAWVATGPNTSESVQFSLPAGKTASDYISLDVIANGVRSAPVVFNSGVGAHVNLGEFSDQSPAVASLNNQPYIAWRGRDNHFLNVMQLHDDGSAVEATKYISTATVNGSPALATLGNQMYVAWTGDDHSLYISTVNVGGGKISVPVPVKLPETSNNSPALAAFNGNLFIAWTGQGDRFLNVMEVHPDLTFDEPHYVSGATVSGSPALAASNGQLFVAITGDTESLYVSPVITNGPIVNGTPIGVPPFVQLPETSNSGPALADDNGQLLIGWTGQGQNYLNVMHLNTTGGTITPVEPHPVRQGETASSAVALDSNSGLPVIAWTGTDGAGTLYTAPVSFLTSSPGFSIQNGVLVVNGGVGDGTISIQRIDDGGLEVTLNGTTQDYAAGSIVAVVVNTSPNTNTVDVLSTVKGIPVTINTGSGTNLIDVTPGSESLTDLAGALTIHGGTGGTTDVVFDDRQGPLAQTYTITSTTFASPYSAKVTFTNLQGVSVDGGTGNDTLVVDSSAGLVALRDGINFAGGSGFNSLQLVQTGGATRAGDVYSAGPNPGQGSSIITDPGVTQAVYFQGLAPVLDTVPAAVLTVDATPANNAISFGPGLVDPVNDGRVAIDNLEPIEFSGKTNLVINGLAGADTFSLNDPNTPTGLTGIAVSGAGSGGLDSLAVNGVGATVGVDVASSTITGAAGAGGAVPVTFDTMGSLTVNAGAATQLAVSNSGAFTFTPGPAADAGAVQTSALPISFTGLGAGKTLALTGSGPAASLVVDDPTSGDTLSVAATSGTVGLAGRAAITTTSVAALILNGLAGVDTFNVAGAQPYSSITLSGAGGIANLTGNGAAVSAGLGGAIAAVSGGGLGAVSLPGIATVNLNAGAGDITLAGASGPDAFTVTPTGPNTATAQVGALVPVVNTTNTGTSNLTVDGGAGSNALTVVATSGPDVINVGGASVSVLGLKPVRFIDIGSLQVNGLAGADTFNVSTSAAVPIGIDGGDPANVLPGDRLNVVTNSGDSATFTPGPTGDQGAFVVDSSQPITFAHIESLSVVGGGTTVLDGTNANDVIAVTARDGSYAAGADGIQDFTATINGGPSFLFLNTPSVVVDSLAGSNQIAIQAPAPDLAAWNVAVTIDGGSATGNQLTVVTPGTNQATYSPASASGGAFQVQNAAGTVANVALANIQSLVYDGQSGNDALTVEGSSGNNAFVASPGAANDAGTLIVDLTLPLTYQNLGAGGQVIVQGNGGSDRLLATGTTANDGFTISSNALGGEVNINGRVPLITAGVQTLTLQGNGGDDTFTMQPTIASSPYATVNLQAGAPASSTGSQANLTAAAGADLTVSGQAISQGGVVVAGSGLANENLTGAGNHLVYNGIAGVTENVNILASTTASQGQLSIPGVAHWSYVDIPAIDVNGNAADGDTLTFTGTNNTDTFQINLAAAGTLADPVLRLQTATDSPLLTLAGYTGFSTLNVSGLDGADTFNVYTGPTTGRNIALNGNLPSGKKKLTDTLNVFYMSPRPKIVQSAATQNPNSGLVEVIYGPTSDSKIQYSGIEKVTVQKQ